MTDYILKLRTIWEELSFYDSFYDWKGPKDVDLCVIIVDKNRVFQFLVCLRDEFEYACVHVLGFSLCCLLLCPI